MTMKELEKRLAALEAEVKELRGRMPVPPSRSWITDLHDKYKNDPELAAAMEEGDRLVMELREQDRLADLAAFDRQEAEAAKAKKKPLNGRRKRGANVGA